MNRKDFEEIRDMLKECVETLNIATKRDFTETQEKLKRCTETIDRINQTVVEMRTSVQAMSVHLNQYAPYGRYARDIDELVLRERLVRYEREQREHEFLKYHLGPFYHLHCFLNET